MPLAPCMSRAWRAIPKALPQLLRFIMLIISGAAFASSIRRPTRRAALQTKCDVGLHIGQFQLEKLCLGKRFVELFAIQTILARSMPAEFSSAQNAP